MGGAAAGAARRRAYGAIIGCGIRRHKAGRGRVGELRRGGRRRQGAHGLRLPGLDGVSGGYTRIGWCWAMGGSGVRFAVRGLA